MNTNFEYVRSIVIEILCNTEIFPVGYKGKMPDIKQLVKPHLPKDAYTKVEDIDHCIREAVQTLAGYQSSTNATVLSCRREMVKHGEPGQYIYEFK